MTDRRLSFQSRTLAALPAGVLGLRFCYGLCRGTNMEAAANRLNPRVQIIPEPSLDAGVGYVSLNGMEKERPSAVKKNHFRFHAPHVHLAPVFGNDWFALRAEAFARFFGTPTFLVGQTIIVAVWITLNALGVLHFDIYPFILLNLAFSLQAAYAAPLILLAQTRQADRDKAHAEADALHREDLAQANERRMALAAQQATNLLKLMRQNTELTETIKTLTERIQTLTEEVHRKMTEMR